MPSTVLWTQAAVPASSTTTDDLTSPVRLWPRHFAELGSLQWQWSSRNLGQALRLLGHDVLLFDYNTGWDFNNQAHQRSFLELQDRLEPRFIWLAPPCTKWSPLQRLACRDHWQKEALDADRDREEYVHLRFLRRLFSNKNKRETMLELNDPRGAESWKTKTFQSLEEGW